MYVGTPNMNVLVPLKKLTITPKNENGVRGKPIEVLYNPDSYVQSRMLVSSNAQGANGQEPYVITAPGGEVLQFRLFFDAVSAGGEVGGSVADKLKFAANSLLPSALKYLDVRKYTEQIYCLMEVGANSHHPPRLILEWGNLYFEGILIQCTQNFVKFNELGKPLRAWMDCTFLESMDPAVKKLKSPLNSPDTTKFRTVKQGDSLWAMADKAYGQPEQWRAIADANGIVNPRLLRSGESLALPALLD